LYYNFSKANYRNVEYNKSLKVSIGMDFNVNPMTATIGHIIGNEYHQFGEAYLTNSNTYEMSDYLNERYGAKNCIIYPDSTGKARESNATHSDLEILKRMGFEVRARSINPRIKDRVNSVNSIMKPMIGNPRYFVNPKCVKTINDLSKVLSTNDGREDKKQEAEGLVHISSALGYLVAYNWPIKNTLEFLT